MTKCRLCGNERSVSNVLAKDNDGEDYVIAVCDTCWDAIASVAKVAMNDKFKEIDKNIDRLIGILETMTNNHGDMLAQVKSMQGQINSMQGKIRGLSFVARS